MNDTTAPLTASVPLAGPPASEHTERGRTNGLPLIFWLLEQNIWALLSVPTVVALIVGAITHLHWQSMVAAWLARITSIRPEPLLVIPMASSSRSTSLTCSVASPC